MLVDLVLDLVLVLLNVCVPEGDLLILEFVLVAETCAVDVLVLEVFEQQLDLGVVHVQIELVQHFALEFSVGVVDHILQATLALLEQLVNFV